MLCFSSPRKLIQLESVTRDVRPGSGPGGRQTCGGPPAVLRRAGWTRSGFGLALQVLRGPSYPLDFQEHDPSQQEDSTPASPSLFWSNPLPSRNVLEHQDWHPKQPPHHFPKHGLKGTRLTLRTQPRGVPSPGHLAVLENPRVKAGDTSQLGQSPGLVLLPPQQLPAAPWP